MKHAPHPASADAMRPPGVPIARGLRGLMRHARALAVALGVPLVLVLVGRGSVDAMVGAELRYLARLLGVTLLAVYALRALGPGGHAQDGRRLAGVGGLALALALFAPAGAARLTAVTLVAIAALLDAVWRAAARPAAVDAPGVRWRCIALQLFVAGVAAQALTTPDALLTWTPAVLLRALALPAVALAAAGAGLAMTTRDAAAGTRRALIALGLVTILGPGAALPMLVPLAVCAGLPLVARAGASLLPPSLRRRARTATPVASTTVAATTGPLSAASARNLALLAFGAAALALTAFVWVQPAPADASTATAAPADAVAVAHAASDRAIDTADGYRHGLFVLVLAPTALLAPFAPRRRVATIALVGACLLAAGAGWPHAPTTALATAALLLAACAVPRALQRVQLAWTGGLLLITWTLAAAPWVHAEMAWPSARALLRLDVPLVAGALLASAAFALRRTDRWLPALMPGIALGALTLGIAAAPTIDRWDTPAALDGGRPAWVHRVVDGAVPSQLRLDTALAHGFDVPAGTEAVLVRHQARGAARAKTVAVLRVGTHTAEWAALRPDVAARQPPLERPAAWQVLPTAVASASPLYFRARYRVAIDLDAALRGAGVDAPLAPGDRLVLRRARALPTDTLVMLYGAELRR